MADEDSKNDLIEAQFQDAEAILEATSTPAEYATALAEFRRLGEQGHVGACTNAGYMYANGIGTETDYAEARQWLSRGAEQGDAAAINNLAVMLHHGMGCKADPVGAYALFETAAIKGDMRAQLTLGDGYESGEVLPQDLRQAEHWYRAAAQQGHPYAMFLLGRLLLTCEQGIDLDLDALEEGAKWLEAAAETGDPEYQYHAGLYFETVPELRSAGPSPKEWFEKAAAQGHALAKAKLSSYEETDDSRFALLLNQPIVQEIQHGPPWKVGTKHVSIVVTAEPSRDLVTIRFGAPVTEFEETQYALSDAPGPLSCVEQGFKKIADSRGLDPDSDGPRCREGDQVTIEYRKDEGSGSSIAGVYRLTYEFSASSESGYPWRMAGELTDYHYRDEPTVWEALTAAKIRTIQRFALDSASEASYCEQVQSDVNTLLPKDLR
jgi:TPR repeat protein